MKNPEKDERGSALLIAMAVLLMLTVAAMMAVDTAQTDIELSFYSLHRDQAFYTAEAGLQRAFMQLNQEAGWNDGYVNVSFEQGTYSVAVVDSTVDPALVDTVLLRATGEMQKANANLEAIVVPEYRYPFRYAMFSDDTLTMDNNTCTDSYRSDSGSFAATYLDSDADIGSNEPIILTNTALVNGGASTAIEDGITMSNVAEVRGDTATGVPRNELDIVSASDYEYAELNNNAPYGFRGNGYTYRSGTGELELAQNATMQLSSGTYLFSSIVVGNSASIEILPGEDVTIYLTGNLELGQSASVNAAGSPANLTIFSQGNSLMLGQSTELRAAFYGPNTEVTIDNNTDFYGSVVAGKVNMRNHSCFHYDRALSKKAIGTTGNMLMVAWKEL